MLPPETSPTLALNSGTLVKIAVPWNSGLVVLMAAELLRIFTACEVPTQPKSSSLSASSV